MQLTRSMLFCFVCMHPTSASSEHLSPSLQLYGPNSSPYYWDARSRDLIYKD